MSALFRRKKKEAEPPPPVEPAPFADGSATTYITGDRQRDTDRMRLLIDSLRAVSSATEHEELMVLMVDRAVKTVGAERGLLFLKDEEGRPVLHAARSSKGKDLARDTAFSSQVVLGVLETGDSVCKRDDEDGDFDPSQSMINLNIRSVMCVPLVLEDERLGAIYVDARATEHPFGRSDLRFFEAFADMLSIVWSNRQNMDRRVEGERMARDLELVREIQESMLPLYPLKVQGYSMCGKVIPADEAGGDYFDFFTARDGRVAMAVGDVSGHGAGPSLFMSGARSYLRAYCQSYTSPAEIVERLNGHLTSDMGDDMFISMFLCMLDPATREFTYANAGHPPPMLVHPSGDELEEFPRTGMALGVEEEMTWGESDPHSLAPGDTMIMFTDGILELRRVDGGEEQYGRDRLSESVRRHRDGTPEELLEGIFADALKWAGTECRGQDDLTVAVLRAESA